MPRLRLRPLLPALLLLLLGAPPAPADVARTASLAQRLQRVLAEAKLKEGRYGVAVLERGPSPRVVFARGHTNLLRPASVAKVLTAAAALDLLGPAHVFTTGVSARGTLDPEGTLHGDLVVHGTGDPNLSGRFHEGDPLHLLDRLAAAVRRAGIRRVTGALVLDDGPIDRDYVHPSWSKADRGRWYGAGVAGLSFNDGCADVVVRGADAPGKPAQVEVVSTLGPWDLDSSVETAAAGKTTVAGYWVNDDRALRVRGTVPQKATYSFAQPVPDPLAFFGGAFVRRLAQAGVRVEGGVRAATDAADRRRGERWLAQHGSALGPTLDVMNQRSQNFYAALVFKCVGVALEGWGTWESGQHAVSEMLRRRGLDPDAQTRIVDGSGLSLENRTTAATLARLLVSFEGDLTRGPALYRSLAVPGEEGTLRRRLRGRDVASRLHAKTGTLGNAGVHALAGYLDGEDGHPGYVFAILIDGVGGGRSVIDRLIGELGRP